MDYKKNIEGADEMDTDELFERLNDNERIELLFETMENSYDIIFQLQQNVDHNAKTSAIQKSMIDLLIDEGKFYSQQLGGHGQKSELLDKLKKEIEADFKAKPLIEFYKKQKFCDDFDVSTKTFERLKKSGEIKVSTIGGSDYVLKEDIIDLFKGKKG